MSALPLEAIRPAPVRSRSSALIDAIRLAPSIIRRAPARTAQVAPPADRRTIPERINAPLRAHALTVDLPSGKRILDNVTFDLPTNSLTAVIGPSGAGKTTLLRALTGSRSATSGSVWCGGHDLYECADDLRHQIGVVPQDDIVHPQLTVSQALGYAADLRFHAQPAGSTRAARVEQVMRKLHLQEHADTRVEQLSGGQRKRVSVAMELLTEPSLLLLDEPTSGLDPGLDRSVMRLLRELADGGRTVVVVTHSVAHLHLCDRVILLAPGGKLAYDGPPQTMLRHFALGDVAEVFHAVTLEPDAYQRRLDQVRGEEVLPAPLPGTTPDRGSPNRPRPCRQLATLLRRQRRVVAGDRSYAIATLGLPMMLALMVLAIPGDGGLAEVSSDPPSEASQVLVIMMVGAAFMGAAATIRELVAERAIFLRERAVGLSTVAYVACKVGFVAVLTAAQAAVLVGLVVAIKPAPAQAVMIGTGSLGAAVELVAATWLTAFVAAGMGLGISAVVGSNDQVMPALVVTIMGQLVLCGGLIEVTGRLGLEQLSWLAPARWGFAAAAATADLTRLVPAVPDDALWSHTAAAWGQDIAALGLLCTICVLLTWVQLRRTRASV